MLSITNHRELFMSLFVNNLNSVQCCHASQLWNTFRYLTNNFSNEAMWWNKHCLTPLWFKMLLWPTLRRQSRDTNFFRTFSREILWKKPGYLPSYCCYAWPTAENIKIENIAKCIIHYCFVVALSAPNYAGILQSHN